MFFEIKYISIKNIPVNKYINLIFKNNKIKPKKSLEVKLNKESEVL